MTKALNLGSLAALFLILVSCDQGNDRLKEKAAIESEESAKKQIDADKNYLKERAGEMELDLARRQRFYGAVTGIYEGEMKGEKLDETLKVRFTLAPSLPPYSANRVRALDEIVADLNNLYFNVQVIQWVDDGSGSESVAFGCVFQNVRPDLDTGQMHLASSDCSSLYIINVAEDIIVPTKADLRALRETSTRISRDLLDGSVQPVESLKGLRQVTKSATYFHFAVNRVQ